MTQPTNHAPVSVRSLSGRSYLLLRLSRRFLVRALAVATAGAVIALAAVWFIQSLKATVQNPFGSDYVLPAGPWGELSVLPILVGTPKEKISATARLGDGNWYFRADSGERVAAMLRDCGLGEAEVLQAANNLRAVAGRPEFLAATPSAPFITALQPEVRSRIYGLLSRWPENKAQTQPFHTSEEFVEKWLAGIPADTAEQIRSLLWRRGTTLLFSDYNIVADRISSPQEKLAVLEAISRKPSMILKLRVGSRADVGALVRYWGAQGRAEKIHPLLDSLARSGGANLDVSNLLPAFARQRLYRYPDPLPGSELGPDCHFTSLNFFAVGPPDTRPHDPLGAEAIFKEQYVEARGEPQFGDLVVLTTPEGDTVHSAVHIAANIVFTKNGMGLSMPWVFSTLEQMLIYYPGDPHLQVSYYRKRP